VLAAVVRAESEWHTLPASAPPSIQQLLHRCLEKNPRRRLQAIGDARIVIEETLSGIDVAPTLLAEDGNREERRDGWRRTLPWAVTSACLRREIHAAQQRLEPRVAAQRVEDGIDMKKRKPAAVVLLVSPVKPLENLVPPTQSQKHKSVG
jgi:hypothetical protein